MLRISKAQSVTKIPNRYVPDAFLKLRMHRNSYSAATPFGPFSGSVCDASQDLVRSPFSIIGHFLDACCIFIYSAVTFFTMRIMHYIYASDDNEAEELKAVDLNH